MKTVQVAGIISLFIVIFNLIIRFITRPIYSINQFKREFWFELTGYLIALVSIFFVVYLILVIKKSFIERNG
ncbi:hypothetical protein ABER75_23260 [Niallia taxi]|uniref:hypothetical protein n=1 Tax=Niallia taxi TaxID=2499688 RepID=UPI00203B60C5|nr:hypothetical protein [Niallia taxi]MCM3213100.1 hypothetical protein [Niallia taxi]MDK8641983.1 hypothetical protein [Niallia taxi]MED4036440.1 hypothetical protein [Niallia taxi]